MMHIPTRPIRQNPPQTNHRNNPITNAIKHYLEQHHILVHYDDLPLLPHQYGILIYQQTLDNREPGRHHRWIVRIAPTIQLINTPDNSTISIHDRSSMELRETKDILLTTLPTSDPKLLPTILDTVQQARKRIGNINCQYNPDQKRALSGPPWQIKSTTLS